MSLFSIIESAISSSPTSTPGTSTLPPIQKTGPLGLQLIEYFEGLRLTAYEDSAGIATIGYGHVSGVHLGDTCTFDEAVAFLTADLLTAENTILHNVAARVKQNEFDALVSFCFNVGSGNFLSSSVYMDLQRFTFTGIPYHLSLWNKAGGRVVEGLVTRRHAEGVLFSTGVLDLAPVLVPDSNQA